MFLFTISLFAALILSSSFFFFNVLLVEICFYIQLEHRAAKTLPSWLVGNSKFRRGATKFFIRLRPAFIWLFFISRWHFNTNDFSRGTTLKLCRSYRARRWQPCRLMWQKEGEVFCRDKWFLGKKRWRGCQPSMVTSPLKISVRGGAGGGERRREILW